MIIHMRVRSSSALCQRLKCAHFACRWVLMPPAQLARGRVRAPATLFYQAMHARPLRLSVGTKLHIAMGGRRTILNPEARCAGRPCVLIAAWCLGAPPDQTRESWASYESVAASQKWPGLKKKGPAIAPVPSSPCSSNLAFGDAA